MDLRFPGLRNSTAVRKKLLVLVPMALVLALSGCLEDATDTCYRWDNTADANSSTECAGETTTGSSGRVTIVAVAQADELVVIANQGSQEATMTAWTLSAENNIDDAFVYIFPAFTLSSGNIVRIHSRTGDDTTADLYWGDGIHHWADGDTAVLRDTDGDTISSCATGQTCWATPP